MCSWIFSVFESRDETTMMTLYRSLVRSRLEFCSPLWTSNKVEDIVKLENIQRSFTKRIEGNSELDYWNRVSRLKLMSLQRRRERYTILHLYKILNNTAPNDLNITFTTNERRGILASVPTLSRIATKKFQTLYDSSFAVFAPRLWNCLPKSIRHAESFTKFKAALTRHLLSIPDEPPISGVTSRNSLLHWSGRLERQMMS